MSPSTHKASVQTYCSCCVLLEFNPRKTKSNRCAFITMADRFGLGREGNDAPCTFIDISEGPFGVTSTRKTGPICGADHSGRVHFRRAPLSNDVGLVRHALKGFHQGLIRLNGTSKAHHGIQYSTGNTVTGLNLPYLRECPRDGPIPVPGGLSPMT